MNRLYFVASVSLSFLILGNYINFYYGIIFSSIFILFSGIFTFSSNNDIEGLSLNKDVIDHYSVLQKESIFSSFFSIALFVSSIIASEYQSIDSFYIFMTLMFFACLLLFLSAHYYLSFTLLKAVRKSL